MVAIPDQGNLIEPQGRSHGDGRCFSALAVVLLLLASVPGQAQDLQPTGGRDLIEETVQEVAWLPGNAASPRGWAVVGRTNTPSSSLQGITFVNLTDFSTCDRDLLENVQDVVVFDGLVYATLKEAGSPDEAVAILDPGQDPCATLPSVVDILGDPLRNATNLRVGRFFGQPHALVANSFPAGPCGASYQREDLAVFLWDVSGVPGQLVSRWAPGEDGTLFQPSCDRCAGLLCGPEDTAVWSDAGGSRWMAVAALLDGVWIVDATDLANPAAVAHLRYTYTGRDANGDPLPDRLNVPGDIEVTPDGRYLITADQSSQGGHILVWSTQEILDRCGDPLIPCQGTDVEPVAEVFPPGAPPGFSHKLVPDWPYLWVTWFDFGVVLLDLTDPTDPRVVARHDVLPSHPAGSFNQWGAYGAALARTCDAGSAASELLISDIGIYASGGSDSPGGVRLVRWAGTANVTGPFRVARTPSDRDGVRLVWERAPLSSSYRVYTGVIDRANVSPLDGHNVPDPSWCALDCCEAIQADTTPGEPLDYYLLRPRDECGNLGALDESSTGPRFDPEPTICP